MSRDIPVITAKVTGEYRTLGGKTELEVSFTCPYCPTGYLKRNGKRGGKPAVHRHGAPAGWDGMPIHKASHCYDDCSPLKTSSYYVMAR